MASISYGITVYDEYTQVKELLSFLLKEKRSEDEIVVLFDEKHGSSEVLKYLRELGKAITFVKDAFKGDFSSWKNLLNAHCQKDFIFQIDADEQVSGYLLKSLPTILDSHDLDLLFVPRINLVSGITDVDIKYWKWRMNHLGWINFPDYQSRIYKNSEKIFWRRKVHEVITGVKKVSTLPAKAEWSLLHAKEIKKQREQCHYYYSLELGEVAETVKTSFYPKLSS